ncbi:hypothetical protein [Chryseobacterium populi]|uniref:C1q domain containing protein n=1 Tax=Chryseobacterium populi TaxID=1144316 RepID=J2KB90_9FLAO|nr:hypothetical protein [Chryseobacterium populi]EJL70448.1 hypothetical protein PMI13_02783 [Chryseobacterium populi]
MKKQIFLILGMLISMASHAQMGINNTDPKATLDVTAKANNGTTSEGIIAPRLTGDQIKAGDAQYGTAQTGIIVYATAAVAASSTKTVNITSAGYYFFDGSIWQKFLNNLSSPTFFIPKVVTAGKNASGSNQTINGASSFTKLTFSPSTNDGNWSTANNSYTVPEAGFYQISLQALVTPNTGTNSINWIARVTSTSGQQRVVLASIANYAPNSAINRAANITLNLSAGDVVEYGIATGAGSNYVVSSRSFTITFLGS